MRETNHEVEGRGLGTTHTLKVFDFGPCDARPHVYVQGGLHADEAPGMIAARALCDRLRLLEADGRIVGRVSVVPVANPIGMSQFGLGQQEGRFDYYDGRNFNRFYPDLAPGAAKHLAGGLSACALNNMAIIRAGLQAELSGWDVSSPPDRLRKLLLRLAIDADYVLDLHCDGEAEVHLYTQPAFAGAFETLAAHLGARAVLLAENSGDNPFDEAVGRPWVDLAQTFPGFPVPMGCASATVELRGRMDVGRSTAAQDATAIERFLTHLGVLSGDVEAVPTALCEATPLAGSEALIAPLSGLLAYTADLGQRIAAGDTVAEIVNPLTGAVTPVKATTAGIFYARADTRIAEKGKRLGKIAGTQPMRSGLLLSP